MILALIGNMLSRLDDVNGELFHAEKGITKGNPLSPLLGGLYLRQLDQTMSDYCETRGLIYKRFMDDWIILCHTRNQLRTVVRLMNEVLEQVKMTKHPYKTYIGRIKDEGFDFLGYRLASKAVNGLTLAWKTWANHRAKLAQLYEQGASQDCIAGYVKRWLCWVRSGVKIDLKQMISGFKSRVKDLGVYSRFF